MFWNKERKKGKQETIRFKDKEDVKVLNGAFIMENMYSYICSKACSVCWDKPFPDTVEGMLDYLSKRVKLGHESVLEHSNLVTYFEMDESFKDSLIEFIAPNKYLRVVIRKSSFYDGLYYVLIGGSIRGYKDLIKGIRDQSNRLLIKLKSILYEHSYKELFVDLIADGVMEESAFSANTASNVCTNTYTSDIIDIENFDSYDHLCNQLKLNCEEYALFNMRDLSSMITITILFKNMSRTATHQLVRHRNAITQESQRYVDYSGACFANPAKFKPDKYKPDEKYSINFAGNTTELTLDELGNAMMSIYAQLIAPSTGTPLLREDARGFLPSNVECKKLYMTFTYTNLLTFLHLRCDPAAQAEIRSYALAIRNVIMDEKSMNELFGVLSMEEKDLFGISSISTVSGIDISESITGPAYKYDLVIDTEEAIEVLEEETIK